MNYIAEKFISNIIEEIKDYNETRKLNDEKVNIPFTISPLVQVLESNNDNGFITDLEKWCDYNIDIKSGDRDCYTSLIAYINLAKTSDDYDFNYMDYPNYNYMIMFGYDDRYSGYCECQLGDEDFREDKGCCGHRCDWTAPSVEIKKVLNIVSHNWSGDQHDYWDFEDKYYSNDAKSKEEKEKREKEARIKVLKEQIAKAQEELAKYKL